jgi:membrane protein
MRLPGGGRMSGKLFLKRLYQEYENDAVADSAGALSYYFVYSLFPFLFFLVTLTAYLPWIRQSVGTALDRLRDLMPAQAMSIVEQHIKGLVARPRPHLLTVGLAVAIYSGSRGVDAIRKALNLAYDVKESRPFWQTELIALGMTAGGAFLLLVGVAALAAGGDIGLWAARHLDIAKEYVLLWSWLRWPITAFIVMLAAALAYYVLPDVKQEFKFITPGSVFGTLIWLLASWGFGQYVSHFGSYNVTYGSIGGVVILLTWFYISGFVFLMGGEANAIIEHHSAEGKASGARAPDQAPPPPEERPSAMPVGAAKSAEAASRSRGGSSPSQHPH